MTGSETRALMGLTCVLEPGQERWDRLVDRDGADAAWERLLHHDSPQGSRARRLDLDSVERETELRGFRFVHRRSGEWLPALDDLECVGAVGGIDGGRPLGLWVAGPVSLSELGASGVAIVGARASTPYGDTVASEMAAELAEAGTVVVSGGAFGIDAAAHRGALSSEGATVAVMACGLDQLYPRGNDALLRRVRDSGLVVSEYPPDSTPSRQRFLTRNRLIAALASATVVVEAAVRSGAKNTVGWAQSLGRPVLAVPGPVTSALSVTPHRLIRDAQAALVTNASDVLAELAPLGVLQPPLVDPEARPTDELDPEELTVREAFPARRPISVDELRSAVGLGVGECLAVLGSLADRGHVQALDDGTWRLVAGPPGSVVRPSP
ncbi:MAG: DNA-processing protein DprA [Propionibacteriaceae bacterium]